MSISPFGAMASTPGAIQATLTRHSGFAPHLATALGRGHGGGAHRIQETGAVGSSAKSGMAGDARALTGDLLGSLGADCRATAGQAAAAYAGVAGRRS
jgi:hypothetical protein